MSVSGPSPLGTLMVQRVEGALGVTGSQQANIASGARPDAVTQPGQPDKTDAVKNPPPKSEEGTRQLPQGRHGGLAALARNDPEIARLLAARNAPMTSYTASAPTSLGQAAKTILALLQQFPEARPVVTGRAPLLGSPPGQGQAASASGQAGGAQGGSGGQAAASTASEHRPVGGNLDPRAIEALTQRAAGTGSQAAAARLALAAHAAAGRLSGAPAPAGSTMTTPGGTAPTAAAGAFLGPGGLALTPGSVAGQFAQALSQALQGSGLFYESHLREFAFGQRSLEQIRSEPQAQLGRESASNPQAAGATKAGAENANPTSGSQATQGAATAGQAAAQSTQASAALAGALLGMDPATHVLVRQQLETLANQAFAWQGEAWPGGEMEWEVQRREPQGEGQEFNSWSTRLKLKLPGLGEVVARLSLANNQLIMHLAAPESAGLIADHTAQLRDRLSAHGLQLSQFTITRESASSAEPDV